MLALILILCYYITMSSPESSFDEPATPDLPKVESYMSSLGTGKPRKSERSRDTGTVGLHDTNLFDEDERSSDGAQIDEADGTPYDNSTFTDHGYYTQTGEGAIYDPMTTEGSLEDIMGAIPQQEGAHELDDAARWLHDNEPPTEDIPSKHKGAA